MSDHLPLSLCLNIKCNYLKTKEKTHKAKVAWYKVDINNKMEYKSVMNLKLNNLKLPHEALQCKMYNCSDHLKEINEFHNDIINACLSAGYESLPMTGKSTEGSHKSNTKPGWNEYCKDKKEIALYWHHQWVMEGRPHNTFNAIMRRKSRLQYHYSVKCIQKNVNLIKSEKNG